MLDGCATDVRQRGSCGVDVLPDDCVMWTPCGVARNGVSSAGAAPHNITAWQEAQTASDDGLPAAGSGRRLTQLMSRGAFAPTNADPDAREWTSPAEQSSRRAASGGSRAGNWTVGGWAWEDVYVKNNVSYHFNVLRRDPESGRVEAYGLGLQTRYSFYRVTQGASDDEILFYTLLTGTIMLAFLVPLYLARQTIYLMFTLAYKKHNLRRGSSLVSLQEENMARWRETYGRWLTLERMAYIFGKVRQGSRFFTWVLHTFLSSQSPCCTLWILFHLRSRYYVYFAFLHACIRG
jgi:hypothetical protein